MTQERKADQTASARALTVNPRTPAGAERKKTKNPTGVDARKRRLIRNIQKETLKKKMAHQRRVCGQIVQKEKGSGGRKKKNMLGVEDK